MIEPIVTIITPTYNHEKYIKRCLDSAIQQTFTDWELIVVDDDSTDGTSAEISKVFDKRIRYFHQKNKGIERLAESYNKALELAKGKYIAILEGDDYWPADKLEKQILMFRDKNIVLTWGRASWVKEDGTFILNAPENMKQYKKMKRLHFLQKLLFGNFIPAITVMLRTTTLRSIGGFQQPCGLLMVDYPTWLKVLQVGEMACSSEVLGNWRRHGLQMSTHRQLELMDGARNYAISCYENLSPEIKTKLTINKKNIQNRWNIDLSLSGLYEGRKYLVKKQWQSARNEFMNALTKGTIQVRLKALLGYIASLGHFQIENLVGILKKEKIDKNETWE